MRNENEQRIISFCSCTYKSHVKYGAPKRQHSLPQIISSTAVTIYSRQQYTKRSLTTFTVYTINDLHMKTWSKSFITCQQNTKKNKCRQTVKVISN